MKAIVVTRSLPIENPESLIAIELPTPAPEGHDLLVRVRAVSVNPVDTKVRHGHAEDAGARVLGWDAAGVVEAVGPDVTLFAVGDEVYYAGVISRPGSNAELQLVDERIVGPKPRTFDFEQAAAMPLTTITAWEALFERMHIPRDPAANAGKHILIIGGAGGVGSIAIQLAKQLAGLQVVATASRPETSAWVQELGADHVIDHHKPFGPQLQEAGIAQVEYIFCLNSTERHFDEMVDVVAPQGVISTIVETHNSQPLAMNKLQSKSVAFAWELMFTRPLYQTPDMIEQHKLLAEAASLFDKGTLRHTLTERAGALTPENLRRAHARVESGAMIGKLALGAPEL